MGLLKRLLLNLVSAGAEGLFEAKMDVELYGPYNLCTRPFEELTVTLTSIGTLSISDIRLAASPAAAGVSLCTLDGEALTPILASVYDLSTEETP